VCVVAGAAVLQERIISHTLEDATQHRSGVVARDLQCAFMQLQLRQQVLYHLLHLRVLCCAEICGHLEKPIHTP
jgi:hypothetical protein